MLKLLLLLAVTAALTGCSPRSTPVKLPPGATLEVYTIADDDAPNTTPAIEPGTGRPLSLQNPPIITTTDIATAARSVIESETVNGTRFEHTLNVELTPAGSAKMATATATPTGKPIAVVINGQVVCTPKMLSPIRKGSFRISGDSHDVRFTSAVEALTKP